MPKQSKQKHINDLTLYRKRLRLSQAQVATLLGHSNGNYLSELELGHYWPSIPTALKLAVIYRVPVDFLFSKLYKTFQADIRAAEEAERNAPQRQPALPLTFYSNGG